MPGVKNSNTIVPKAKLPARRADFTGLLFIPFPMTSIRFTADNAGRSSFVIAIRNDDLYLLDFGIFGNMTR
jgi:hypothetical protein